jgi:hypothetical protein
MMDSCAHGPSGDEKLAGVRKTFVGLFIAACSGATQRFSACLMKNPRLFLTNFLQFPYNFNIA